MRNSMRRHASWHYVCNPILNVTNLTLLLLANRLNACLRVLFILCLIFGRNNNSDSGFINDNSSIIYDLQKKKYVKPNYYFPLIFISFTMDWKYPNINVIKFIHKFSNIYNYNHIHKCRESIYNFTFNTYNI